MLARIYIHNFHMDTTPEAADSVAFIHRMEVYQIPFAAAGLRPGHFTCCGSSSMRFSSTYVQSDIDFCRRSLKLGTRAESIFSDTYIHCENASLLPPNWRQGLFTKTHMLCLGHRTNPFWSMREALYDPSIGKQPHQPCM